MGVGFARERTGADAAVQLIFSLMMRRSKDAELAEYSMGIFA
jgi:hypothetical protein